MRKTSDSVAGLLELPNLMLDAVFTGSWSQQTFSSA